MTTSARSSHPRFVTATSLRARFAVALSQLYGREVPAYTTLVEVSRQINDEVMAADPVRAQRLGGIDRVSAERHGAIRVGTEGELEQVGRIFAAFGMYPVGFYDLRDVDGTPVPVVSTAFRPVEAAELEANPFRVFTSVLTPHDRRFFDAGTEAAVRAFLARRTLFPPRLLDLSGRATAGGGLPEPEAAELVDLATAAFALGGDPVDAAWYERLERISSVAADIAGVTSTHINHLTPRVLDIDALQARMSGRGIEMIPEIQGPPRWDGPPVLLRQTSFRALAEPRRLRRPDGVVVPGTLRVRFGEVEARGMALTASGRDLVDELKVRFEQARRHPGPDPELAAAIWRDGFPADEAAIARQGLARFTHHRVGAVSPGATEADAEALVDAGVLRRAPIVYEDFLPRSAAGIFQSNLTSSGPAPAGEPVADGDGLGPAWLTDVLSREVADPDTLYERQSRESLRTALGRTGPAS